MKMDKSVQITLIIVVGVIILGLIAFSSFHKSSSSDNTIQVQGISTIKALPDLVGIYFSVDTTGATTQEASNKNSAIVDNLTSSLEALGYNKTQIQTQSYNIYPEYNYPSTTIKDYRATHMIKLEIPANDSSAIGSAVDAGVNSGAGISYINFELTQESQNKYKAEAIKLAAQDATTKAQSVADGFNKKLGRLLSTSVNDFNYIPWLAADFSGTTSPGAIEQKATSIQPSEQDVTATITATFELG